MCASMASRCGQRWGRRQKVLLLKGHTIDGGFVEGLTKLYLGCQRGGHRREELPLKSKCLTEAEGCGDSRPCLLQRYRMVHVVTLLFANANRRRLLAQP